MKIEYTHFRVPGKPKKKRGKPGSLLLYRRSDPSFKPFSKGGVTHCIIRGDDGEVMAKGEGRCSMSDNFSYKIGRRIAYGRAKAKLEAQGNVIIISREELIEAIEGAE